MTITRTFSHSSVAAAALVDEFTKIAQAKKKGKLKKFLKNTAIVAGGYGLGHGAGMLADEFIAKKVLKNIPLEKKKRWVGPALGAATAGSMLIAERLKRMHEE